MKITLTEEEYRRLLELVEAGLWVFHSYDEGNDPEADAHRALAEKLCQQALEAKMNHLVYWSEEQQRCYPTQLLEERVMSRVDRYDDFRFWDGLAERLAWRDLEEQVGRRALERMDRFERGNMLSEIEAWYDEEFHRHGLENLRMKSRPPKNVN
ncbi:MAG TPA: hypothetical protein ENK54_09850 [Thiotrichales bacterium]|nr:hypothetical protein [Thiotrichales bacterium]